MRHVLKMIKHLVLHIEDDPLRNPGVYVVFEDTDDLRNGKRCKCEKDQLNQVLQRRAVRPECIDDFTSNDRRVKTDDRREQNKVRARRMALVMGIACVVFVLAMIVEVYL